VLALLGTLLATSSLAVLIDAGDGRGNTKAPSPDPGWAHIGMGNGLTVTYLGEGWVLSAAHVGEVKVRIGGTNYDPIAGSRVELKHSGSTPSDVELFRIAPYPAALPKLPIREHALSGGELALMVGLGRERGETLAWKKPGVKDGYRWAATKRQRWGTNIVEASGLDIVAFGKTTRSFLTEFTAGGTSFEAQATQGDSGGPVFTRKGPGWELAGVIWGVAGLPGQPTETVVYGNRTFAADLSWYREQIIEIMTPACGNGHVTIDEQCDDGNNVDGDCCSATCTFEAADAACDDGLYCNGEDRCNDAGQCVPTGVDPCDDGDACTEDVCNEPASCHRTPIEGPTCGPRANGEPPDGSARGPLLPTRAS
jgi:cysteine-rich repeat protein